MWERQQQQKESCDIYTQEFGCFLFRINIDWSCVDDVILMLGLCIIVLWTDLAHFWQFSCGWIDHFENGPIHVRSSFTKWSFRYVTAHLYITHWYLIRSLWRGRGTLLGYVKRVLMYTYCDVCVTIWASSGENLSLSFPTKWDSNQSPQLLRLAMKYIFCL